MALRVFHKIIIIFHVFYTYRMIHVNSELEIQEYKYVQVSVTSYIHPEVNQQCHNGTVFLIGMEFASQGMQTGQ